MAEHVHQMNTGIGSKNKNEMMKIYTAWLSMFLLSTSLLNCSGQTKETLAGEAVKMSIVDSVKIPKLLKTQNSTESDNVNSIIEDKKGNLWFGTTGEGVYKFDGKKTIQYTSNNGFRSNKTYCLFEDRKEKIWVGTADGLYALNENTGAFEEVRITNPTNSLHNRFAVFSILEDTNGILWFATVEGVFVYDGNSFELFIVDKDEKGFMSSRHNTEYMLQDSKENMWFGSRVNDGLYSYDGKSIVNYKLKELDGHKWAWPALQDKNGNIWFSNWGGAYRYDGTSFTSFTKKDGLCSKTIARIMEDSQGNIWFGGGEGICRYDGDSFTHFTKKDGLPHNGVWSIFEDKNQNIWIGTKNTGLCMFNGSSIINF